MTLRYGVLAADGEAAVALIRDGLAHGAAAVGGGRLTAAEAETAGLSTASPVRLLTD